MLDTYNKTVAKPWIDGVKDTQYRIEETDSSITVTFQGSHSKLDWWQNFMFSKKLYRGSFIFCHRGFGIKWKAVQNEIMSHIDGSKSIHIRGFSQGSALGELMHEDVSYRYGIQSDTILFGKPRVFVIHRKLKSRLSGITRVENGNDIVTKLPFFWLLYKHYGARIHIGKKRKLFRFSVKDHTTYKENLE